LLVKARCIIEVAFPDAKAADAARISVSHEGDIGNRSKTKVETSGNTLKLGIEADDIVALRASMNAFMRAFQVFEGVEKEEVQK
jgi:tRNA threonylcarbamoyladenosine modification (KEOPS) complex  Pcc1 subunit